MSTRGRGKGKDNKRKYSEHNNSFNNKRRNFDEGFPRNERNWNNKYQFNVNNKNTNYIPHRNQGHYKNAHRSNQYFKQNSHKNFDFPPRISTDSHIEQEKDITGNALLNSERLEKVLATKKRIEEAFASKSSNISNQEIAFEKPLMKETATESKEKNSDGSVPIDSSELILTNSDFKEIGSVASRFGMETEADVSDITLNVAPCYSQQRSFDRIRPPTIPASSKQPRVGGWNVTALNESETGPLYSNLHAVPPKSSRSIGEKYLQKSREEILGNIEHNAKKQTSEPYKTKTGLCYQKPPRMNIGRVGQLYHSFLRSRLSGCTLKLSKDLTKPTGPNPLLDKSVLESQNSKSASESATLQHEMPRPIMIKLEANKATDVESTSNLTEAEEANEFCEEFSHLLTEPNFLIPSEELEKLGLGHLTEMNKLVNERRSSDDSRNISVNSESFLRVRSLNALNSVTENDITYNPPPPSNLTTSSLPELPLNNNFSNSSNVESVQKNMNYEFVSVPGVNQTQTTDIDSRVLINPQSAQDSTLHGIHSPVAENISVESVAEKVINKLFSPKNINAPVLNQHAEFLLRNQILQSGLPGNPNVTSTAISNNSSSANMRDSTNQLQEVSSKVLRMFVIDKQIDRLRQEKMEIYKELLSIGEISSSLLNSWAEEKIQKSNPRNVSSEQPIASISNYQNSTNANFPSSIPDLLNVATPKSVQSIIVEPFSINSFSNSTSSVNLVTSLPSQSRDGHRVSVGTELHNANKPTLINDSNTHTQDGAEGLYVDALVKTELCSESVYENSSKKSKKKKKGKPEDIIYLIDDSSEEESCNVSVCSSSISVDPLANDESLSTNNETTPSIYPLNLCNNTPTSIHHFRRFLVVGCKDGTMIVFDVKNGSQLFMEKVHEESVNCVAMYNMNQVILGSSDATICLFSTEKKKKTQTVQTPSSVQCIKVKQEKLFAGTKTGQLITYKITTKTNEKGNEELWLKSQETKQFSNSSIISLTVTEFENEEVVIVASRGEQIAVYFTENGACLTRFEWCDTVHCLTVLNNSPLVYCGTNTQSIKVVDFVTGANEPDCLVGIPRSVTKIIFRSNVLFAASTDGKVYIYDTKANKLISSVTCCKGQITGMQLAKRMIIVASNRCELNRVLIPPKVEIIIKKSARSKSIS